MSSQDKITPLGIMLGLAIYGVVAMVYLRNKKRDPRAIHKNHIPKKYSTGQFLIKTTKFYIGFFIIICIFLLIIVIIE